MPETIGAVAAAGAGRYRDMIWPAPDRTSTGAPDASIAMRGVVQIVSHAPVGALTTTNAPPAMANVNYAGLDAVSMPGAALGAGYVLNLSPMRVHLRTARPASVPARYFDESVYRIVFIAATNGGTPATNQDFGFGVADAPGGGPLTPGNNWNIGSVHFLGPNALEYVTRNAGGISRFNLPAIDVTAWHAYEWVLTSASATADASIAFFIDGIQQAIGAAYSVPGAVGSNLGLATNGQGYVPSAYSYPNVAGAILYLAQVHFVSGPTLAAVS